jgi:hypothetical protein
LERTACAYLTEGNDGANVSKDDIRMRASLKLFILRFVRICCRSVCCLAAQSEHPPLASAHLWTCGCGFARRCSIYSETFFLFFLTVSSQPFCFAPVKPGHLLFLDCALLAGLFCASRSLVICCYVATIFLNFCDKCSPSHFVLCSTMLVICGLLAHGW